MEWAKPKYYFCWWCSRQLWAKRAHISMRATGAANENTATVTVHRVCSRAMEREGGWVTIEAM